MTRPDGTSLWGGRFSSEPDPVILAFTGSLPFDSRLARHDLIASLAHVRMLLDTGVLARAHAEPLLDGLGELLGEIETGTLTVEGPDEDVHTWIERTLQERIGSAAGRLHTARSRNDQVSIALRLFTRESIAALCVLLTDLLEAWLAEAERHVETWMPGYTHLQRAQPISLAHHLLAHFWALAADADRLQTAYERAGVSPLGAGALAGSRLPIDPRRSAALLGLDRIYPNSLLAVADRDFVADAAFACAMLMIHLSRWAEEIVLWSALEFGFVRLSDRISQGSSLMPQKKNPEAAELVRGKAGRVIGDLAGLLAMLKGLPFAYNSDLQEDKEALFDALDTAAGSIRVVTSISQGLTYDVARLERSLVAGFVTATDLADLLVQGGTPFREAHRMAGVAVREAESRGCELWELDAGTLAGLAPAIGGETLQAVRPEAAAAARTSEGAPAPERVRDQLADAAALLQHLRDWAEDLRPPPIYQAYRENRLAAAEIK